MTAPITSSHRPPPEPWENAHRAMPSPTPPTYASQERPTNAATAPARCRYVRRMKASRASSGDSKAFRPDANWLNTFTGSSPSRTECRILRTSSLENRCYVARPGFARRRSPQGSEASESCLGPPQPELPGQDSNPDQGDQNPL